MNRPSKVGPIASSCAIALANLAFAETMKTMKVFARTGILGCLMALAFLINPDVARAQNHRNCAWPIEISPEGFGNMVLPESFARDFIIPFDTQYQTMTIKGTYPNVRYFSFVVYKDKTPTDIAGNLYDAQIAPDPGSVNPFVEPETTTSQARTTHQPVNGVNGTYTIVISREDPASSGNTVKVSQDDFVWVFLRMYVPSADPSLSGQSLIGGVPLPTIFLTANGSTQELPPCSPVNDLQDINAYLQAIFQGVDALTGDEGTPSSDRLWFAPPAQPPMRVMPNPDNKYIAMLPGENYQPGRIIVIHGKAPGTPDTYDGSPIWEPARGFRTVDMRYWSLCNNDLALPISVVDCTADLTTDLQGGDYTIVISDDLLRPDWLRRDINWLPWGDKHYPKLVMFRNMLSAPNFPFSVQNAIKLPACTFKFELPNIPQSDDTITAGQCVQQVMGDYYPVAAWCDKTTFIHGGWRACM